MEASKSGNIKAVDTLIKLGAEVDLKNVKGNTALIDASMKGYIDVVNRLLQAKADPLIEDKEGKNCVEKSKSEEVIEVLKPLIHNAKQWKDRNCLVKLMLNHKQTDLFKNINEGKFRAIIKYAGVKAE